MMTDRDLIFDVIYKSVMTLVGAANIWLVYRDYRRCMLHVEDRESPAVVRRDIANITFGAMLAAAWGVFIGMSISSVDRDHRWIEVALLTCVLAFIGILTVRPLRQLHRLPDGPNSHEPSSS